MIETISQIKPAVKNSIWNPGILINLKLIPGTSEKFTIKTVCNRYLRTHIWWVIKGRWPYNLLHGMCQILTFSFLFQISSFFIKKKMNNISVLQPSRLDIPLKISLTLQLEILPKLLHFSIHENFWCVYELPKIKINRTSRFYISTNLNLSLSVYHYISFSLYIPFIFLLIHL